MSNLQLVKSEQFGEVEADIYSNGTDMFMTISQLAACLEYSARRGIEMILERNAYLKEPEFSGTHKLCATDGKKYLTRVFTEDGIYEVTMLSSQPKAKEFRRWIRGVLKALRRGDVKATSMNDLVKRELSEAKLHNSRAREASMWLKISQQVALPEYKQVCASYASGALAGKIVLPLPEVGEKHFKAGEIGKMFGVSANAIGRIANSNGMKTEEYGKLYHDKSPSSPKEVDTFMYNGKAVERFKEILGDTVL